MKEVNKNRKDEILSHHTEVNIDEIWAAIEPQVDIINAEKKRRKRFLIFFLLGAILLTSGGFYMWQAETETTEVKTIIELENNTSKVVVKGAQEELVKTNLEVQSIDNHEVRKDLVNSNDKVQSKVSWLQSPFLQVKKKKNLNTQNRLY